MMIVRDEKISVWQASILMVFIMFANKILVLPSLLYNKAKLGAFLIPLFIFILEFGLLYLFVLLKRKFPDQTFFQILKKHTGKIVTICVFVLMMIFFLSKAVLLYDVTYVFFRNLIYKDSGNFLFLICFLPVINHLAVCGVKVLGRTAQLFFPIIVVLVLFCIGVGFLGINSKPLLFDVSFVDIVVAGLKHFSPFGDTLFLFAIMEKIELRKKDEKVLYILSGGAMLCVVIVTAVFVLSYTYTSFMHPYAMFEIMSYIKEFDGLGRIDIISMVLIVILTYFQLAVYLKGFMACFESVFPNCKYIYSLVIFNTLFILAVNFLVLNLSKAIIYGENYLPFFAVLPFLIVPILCIIALGRKKKEKKE